VRDWLQALEEAQPADEELFAMLTYVAGRGVEIDEHELAGALRRALLVHASGGSLERELTLDARAGETLADDLDDEPRRAQLGRGLAALRDEAVAARLPFVRDALGHLLADTALAWRTYAIALLAEELAAEDA
jgi:hypothetical protein